MTEKGKDGYELYCWFYDWETAIFSSVEAGMKRKVRDGKEQEGETNNFWVRRMLMSWPFKRNMLSSKGDVLSAIWPGLVEGSLLGSLSTMMSKSMSFSVREDMSFSKQKEYSPTVFAVRT